MRPTRTMVPGGRYEQIDLVLVRENLEGFYIGHEHFFAVDDDPHAVAIATGANTRTGCRRIAEFAFDYALRNGRRKVTIVHKANILKILTGLFLETAREVAAKYAGKVELGTGVRTYAPAAAPLMLAITLVLLGKNWATITLAAVGFAAGRLAMPVLRMASGDIDTWDDRLRSREKRLIAASAVTVASLAAVQAVMHQ